ncbi:MAG TPA: hypothetical protein PKW21_12825 [Rhabdaerophilum sp.]|nr:hypothetical protein [Rhabdaerophilum sp.]
MTTRLSFSAILVIVLFVAPAWAKGKRAAPPARQKTELIKITAVGGQEIQVRRAYAMDRECGLLEPNRIVVIVPPTGGTLYEKKLDAFPSYARDNPRHSCNSRKAPANFAIYKAREDFKGTDRFKFAIVYYDGTASHFEVEATVWR